MPKVETFLIADHVFRQEGGKWCLVGVFDNILARSFPVLHPSLGLYLKISDAQGRYDVRVEFQDSSHRCIAQLGGVAIEVPDRLSAPDFGLQGHGLILPGEGTYFLRVFFNDEPSATDIRLTVKHLQAQQP
jgi:hypothetical protein